MNSATTQQQPLQQKWGSGLDAGFLLIPVLLLKRQRELLLDNTELVVLLNLLAAWWDTAKRPYPRSTTIAQRIGVTPRTVQRSLEKLEAKGLILRVRHGTGIGAAYRQATSYDMTGTVDALKRLAVAAEPFQRRTTKNDGSQELAMRLEAAQAAPGQNPVSVIDGF